MLASTAGERPPPAVPGSENGPKLLPRQEGMLHPPGSLVGTGRVDHLAITRAASLAPKEPAAGCLDVELLNGGRGAASSAGVCLICVFYMRSLIKLITAANKSMQNSLQLPQPPAPCCKLCVVDNANLLSLHVQDRLKTVDCFGSHLGEGMGTGEGDGDGGLGEGDFDGGLGGGLGEGLLGVWYSFRTCAQHQRHMDTGSWDMCSWSEV